MPKKLLIVRHAKSDWGNGEISDFNRPLNERGNSNAKTMGERLKAKEIKPELIVSSPALRAITTAKIISNEIAYDATSIFENKSIYDANVSTLLKVITDFDNQYNFIALFGHNNGITDLVDYLADSEIYNIPTCGMVMINFPFDDWRMVSKETGDIEFFDYPKSIDD